MKKIYLQCGYETECKKKDCMKCRKKLVKKYNLNLSVAELCVIEDFAVTDLKDMVETKPEELKLMQDIMFKVMKKAFREERKN